MEQTKNGINFDIVDCQIRHKIHSQDDLLTQKSAGFILIFSEHIKIFLSLCQHCRYFQYVFSRGFKQRNLNEDLSNGEKNYSWHWHDFLGGDDTKINQNMFCHLSNLA